MLQANNDIVGAERRLAEVSARLSASGHRMSPQRAEILRSLVMGTSHPSAEDVYSSIRTRFPNASLATVYKTIDALKELGEIRLVSVAAGRGHYDALDPSNHPHVVCTRCGRTEDVKLEGVRSQSISAADRSGYEITEERLQFFGICPDCQKLQH